MSYMKLHIRHVPHVYHTKTHMYAFFKKTKKLIKKQNCVVTCYSWLQLSFVLSMFSLSSHLIAVSDSFVSDSHPQVM